MEKLCNTLMQYDIEKGSMPKNVMILIMWSFLFRPKYGYSETFDAFHTRITTTMVVPAKFFWLPLESLQSYLILVWKASKVPKIRKDHMISQFQLSFHNPGCCPFENFSMFGSITGCVLRCPINYVTNHCKRDHLKDLHKW